MMAFRQLINVVSAGALAGALAATLAGCGARSTAEASRNGSSVAPAGPAASLAGVPTALTDPACGEVPPALAGRWQKTIEPADLPPELFDADTGVFVITLGPGHHARTDVDDDHRGDDEDFCWTTDRVVYVTDREDCTGDSIGAYEWVLRDDALDLTRIHDDCFWRPFQMIFKTWTRVPS